MKVTSTLTDAEIQQLYEKYENEEGYDITEMIDRDIANAAATKERERIVNWVECSSWIEEIPASEQTQFLLDLENLP